MEKSNQSTFLIGFGVIVEVEILCDVHKSMLTFKKSRFLCKHYYAKKDFIQDSTLSAKPIIDFLAANDFFRASFFVSIF